MNAPPSVQDAAYIRETIDSIEQQAADVRAQMLALEQKLQDLETQRQFFKPMLSPIRRMPLEVLGEIFNLAMDDFRRQTTLSLICRVCKSWREAAHLVPRLWMDVTIDASKPTLTYEGVETWVGHARGLKRTLTITSGPCGQPDYDDEGYRDRCAGRGKCHFSKPVLVKILKDTPLLEKVNIACPTAQCFIMLSKSLSSRYTDSWNKLPSIGMLWDGWYDAWENIPWHMLYDFFPQSVRHLALDLPSLSHITAANPEELEVNIQSRVFKRLTTFKLTCDWSGTRIFKFLQYCTKVEALHLCPNGADLEVDAQNPLVQTIIQNGLLLPKLKTIRLENVQPDSLKRLRFLQMPNAADISIQFGDAYWSPEDLDYNYNEVGSDCGPAFASLLRGPSSSPSALRTLRITNGVFEGDTLLDAVKGLPNLEHLIVDNAVFNEDLFTKLSAKAALPKLETLHLLRLHINPAKLTGLQAFVDKRGIGLKTSRCTSIDCAGAD